MSAIKKRTVTQLPSDYREQYEKNAKNASRKRTLLIRRLIVFFVFVACLSYLMLTTLISQSSALNEINAEKVKLEKELLSLQKEETILQEEIVKLNDDEYIAKLARKDYFLSEENEIIFSIPKEEMGKSTE